MQQSYDTAAPKKATNLSVNSDLLARSRSLNINLSATLEKALRNELAKAEAAQWARENKAAIKAYNKYVDAEGCFSDEFRSF